MLRLIYAQGKQESCEARVSPPQLGGVGGGPPPGQLGGMGGGLPPALSSSGKVM